jgi:hypothetical protein
MEGIPELQESSKNVEVGRPRSGHLVDMPAQPFDREALRRAAAAHAVARGSERQVSEHLARTAQAAAEAGLSLSEIAAIIADSSREAIRHHGLAA